MGTRYGNVGSKNIPKKSTEGKARESGGMEVRINPGKRCSNRRRERKGRRWNGGFIMKTGLIHERFLLVFNNNLSLGMIRVAGQQPPVTTVRRHARGRHLIG